MNQPIKLGATDWQQRYHDGSTGWDRGAPSPMLLDWLAEGQLAPCRIAIPGCGHGYEVVELASRGFDVTAVDFAETPVTHLRQQLAEQGCTANLVVADALSYQPEHPFDAVYDQTFLCAITPNLRDKYVSRLSQWLRPMGQLFALFMQCRELEQSGPPFHCPIEEMQTLFASPEWDWPERSLQRVDHPSGLHELAGVITRR